MKEKTPEWIKIGSRRLKVSDILSYAICSNNSRRIYIKTPIYNDSISIDYETTEDAANAASNLDKFFNIYYINF